MIEPRQNPFPGPQPYRAADRRRFFGREEMAEQLVNRVLSRPCTTVFGPSGAGKSSLMQAAVIPSLEETLDTRVVRVDAWPVGEAPLPWLVRTLFADLDLGTPPEDKDMLEALDEALSLAELRSERPILIYLDQLEQPLLPGRDAAGAEALIKGIDRVANRPLRGLQVVLSLREDYLGRLRDRAQGRRELLDLGFRVGPLSVREMVQAVCRAAAEGEPAQHWNEEEICRLMQEVRVPGESASDEAEVQAAFGQIVCRALWEERAAGSGCEAGPVEAEAILHRYLEATVEGLGELKEEARRLLEQHLIDEEGHRRLLTEREARGALPAAAAEEVLGGLERAAVLHAEEHQGSRYFELGHDWLARRVFDRREVREREEAARKQWEEERAARKSLAAIAAVPAPRKAFATLCGAYWYPVYAFIRRTGHSPEAARDLTEGCFTQLLEKGDIPAADPGRGRFRSFLLGSVERHLAGELDRARVSKRGGGEPLLAIDADDAEGRYQTEPARDLTPERLFERSWALTVLDRVLGALRRDYARRGKGPLFDRIKDFLAGDGGDRHQRDLAVELGMEAGALQVAIQRLRERYQRQLEDEIAQTVDQGHEIRAEIGALLAALRPD